MYDIVGHLKELAESKPDELRLLLISHPQIAEAIVQMQVGSQALGLVCLPHPPILPTCLTVLFVLRCAANR
jgi:hypothetical protein